MRKLTLLILFNFILVFSYAQDEVNMLSKRGEFILPEAGNIGLAIDAIPIVNYFGNAANGNAFNTGAFNFVDGVNFPNTIMGKYMLTESSDVRVKFRFRKGRTKDVEYITRDSLPVSDPLIKVEDIEKSYYSDYTVGIGYEMSRGKGRVQGFYGAEVLIQYVGGYNTYEYGNPITADFTSIANNTTNFGTNKNGNRRVLETKGMNTFGFGLRGFIGVEYFFTPKISIGGEFGWGPGIAKTSEGTVTEEYWDGLSVKQEDSKTAKDSKWALDTDNSSGGVFLTFYF